MSGIYLNVGCGLIAPESWTNLDASWNARTARVPWLRSTLAAAKILPRQIVEIPWPANITFHDVRRGLPYSDSSIEAVYSSHMIEHLMREEAEGFLRECHRVLKDGGLIRLVTPDLEFLVKEYCETKRGNANDGRRAAEQLLTKSGLVQDFRATNSIVRAYRRWKAFDLHKWLYDEASLGSVLTQSGFSCVSRRSYLESAIPGIRDVEREDRILEALCLEAVKLRSGPRPENLT